MQTDPVNTKEYVQNLTKEYVQNLIETSGGITPFVMTEIPTEQQKTSG